MACRKKQENTKHEQPVWQVRMHLFGDCLSLFFVRVDRSHRPKYIEKSHSNTCRLTTPHASPRHGGWHARCPNLGGMLKTRTDSTSHGRWGERWEQMGVTLASNAFYFRAALIKHLSASTQLLFQQDGLPSAQAVAHPHEFANAHARASVTMPQLMPTCSRYASAPAG